MVNGDINKRIPERALIESWTAHCIINNCLRLTHSLVRTRVQVNTFRRIVSITFNNVWWDAVDNTKYQHLPHPHLHHVQQLWWLHKMPPILCCPFVMGWGG